LSTIKGLDYYHPDFQSWHSTVKQSLRQIFGTNSYQVTEYDKIAWHTSDKIEDQVEQHKLYLRSCIAAEGILKGAIHSTIHFSSNNPHHQSALKFVKRNFSSGYSIEENLPAQPLPAAIVYASVNPTNLYARSPELPDIHFAIFFKVENKSLSRLENIKLGVITWILGSEEERINERLLENIEVVKPTDFRHLCKLVHYSCKSAKTDTLTIEPYEIVRTKDFGKIAIPESEAGYEWQAALYLISEGFLPLWYQLTCKITNSHQFFTTETRLHNIKFNLVHNSLPVATWK
jgi:hypothetical protein